MIKGLYFSTGDAAAAADKAIVLNADNFVSMGTVTTTTTKMYFLDRANTGAETVLTLTHAEARGLDVIEDVCEAIASEPKDGFIVIADVDNSNFASPYITDCTFTTL